MKKTFLTTTLMLTMNLLHSQVNDPFTVTGQAKLIGSWATGQKIEVTFTSSTSDQFKIYQGQQGMILTVSYKNTSEMLEQVDHSGEKSVHAIKVYEFDFDNDGDKEFIVVSRDSRDVSAKVFKISKGLVKMIGNFKPQYEIAITKNFITFPYGGQGLKNEYYFRNDAFYELVYHSPKG